VRRTTLLLVLLGSATFFAGLGRPAIGDSDEAFYAEAAREMVASGDWITPYYNFETRFQKPILFYWLVAGTYRVAGVHEAAARAWPAAAGLALALLTAAAGRRWYDEPTARLGGTIVVTAFGYFSIGRLSLPDLPLAFFIALATWCALVALCDRPVRPAPWLLTAGAAVGLGFLTKGPLAVILPALVVVPLWWRERRADPLPLGALVAAAAVAVLIAAPWFLAMANTHGRAYVEGFFIGDNVERFATTRFNDPRPIWFYLPIVAGGLLPWTPLAVTAVEPALAWLRRRERPGPVAIRLLVWSLLPLLFFTASIGKQPRYVLPILPPLALLLARAVRRRLAARSDGHDPLLRGATATVGVLLVALGLLLYRAIPIIVMIDPALVTAGAMAIVAAGTVVLAASAVARVQRLPAVVALAAALTLLGLQYGLSPAGRDPVQDMAALVLQHRQDGERIATYRVFVRNLVFYTRARQQDLTSDDEVRAALRSAEPTLVVLGADELRRIVEGTELVPRRLGEVLYFNASAVKLRTLLSPDPKRDLERILLIRNR
jgi:4-amino-4-deoxy-L-arabinose transferase-like glycosyltransferase